MIYIPKVYDVRPDGHNSFSVLPKLGEGDFGDLQAFYHMEIDYTYGYDRAKPGDLWWGIAGFELKAGPAILQPQVRDQNGAAILNVGILLFNSWPGAEEFPSQVDPAYSDRGVGGFTSNGSVGWGFGPESHIGADGGPFMVWASSDPSNWNNRRVGSDAVRKLGWWDDHIVPNPIFQVMRKEGSSPPPVTGAYRLAIVAPSGATLGWVTFGAESDAGHGWLALYHDSDELGRIAWDA
jgi:hypothetical protein